MNRLEKLLKPTPKEAVALAIVGLIGLATIVSIAVGEQGIAIGLVGLLVVFVIAALFELRRRVVEMRSRVGKGFNQLSQGATTNGGTDQSSGAGDVAFRRTLAAIESARRESAERHAEILASVEQLRAEIERISQSDRR